MVPPSAARLGGFAALALVGGLEWRRMVEGVPSSRVALWVLVAVGSAVALLAADHLRRFRDAATLAVTGAALVGAVAASGIDLQLLKPARWDQLADGLGRGLEALGGVWLPYAGADPWPGLTIQFLGAVLCALAGLLAFWPREGGRGHQFIALAGLLALVVTPVVSLGASRPLLLGVVLTAGTVCFLWLERLPLRPGLGLVALLGVALAGALPLAGVADREQPWFDYQSFAEGLGPNDPVSFDWTQSFGPIDWPRTRAEIMRVKAEEPSYWKLRTLEEFDGVSWRDRVRTGDSRQVDPSLDLPYIWRERRDWREDVEVSLRRLRAPEVVGPGTVLRVSRSTRGFHPAGEPGAWRGVSEFRGGDSYAVESYVPRPTATELAQSMSGRHADELNVRVPIVAGGPAWLRAESPGFTVREAVVRFRPFRTRGRRADPPSAAYAAVNRSGDGDEALRSSAYARTWRLAKGLRARARTPFEYVALVARRLSTGFSYAERPPAPARGRAPLDAFVFDSRRGYCQHFAGAMALLLRMGGVPARLAAGFTPGGFSERKDAWIVRDTDAHAWVEAWFDRFGWVALDPTPEATPARSQIASLTSSGGRQDLLGDVLGTEGVPQQGSALEPRGGPRSRPAGDPVAGVGGAGGGGDDGLVTWWTWVLVAVVGGLAAARLVVLRRRRRGRPEAAWRVDRAVAELEAALRRSGRIGASGLTLRQLEQRLAATPEAVAYLRALRSGRYGPARAAAQLPTAAQRRALRRALAAGGGPRARLRALWALPPWRR